MRISFELAEPIDVFLSDAGRRFSGILKVDSPIAGTVLLDNAIERPQYSMQSIDVSPRYLADSWETLRSGKPLNVNGHTGEVQLIAVLRQEE